jgi:hypothetical protein
MVGSGSPLRGKSLYSFRRMIFVFKRRYRAVGPCLSAHSVFTRLRAHVRVRASAVLHILARRYLRAQNYYGLIDTTWVVVKPCT